jgi:twinfilin-like protein
VSKKIETSDPKDIDISWLIEEVGKDESSSPTVHAAGAIATSRNEGRAIVGEEKKSFARPKGPGRKR